MHYPEGYVKDDQWPSLLYRRRQAATLQKDNGTALQDVSQRLGFVGAGDQEQDLGSVVQDRQRQAGYVGLETRLGDYPGRAGQWDRSQCADKIGDNKWVYSLCGDRSHSSLVIP